MQHACMHDKKIIMFTGLDNEEIKVKSVWFAVCQFAAVESVLIT